MKLKKLVSLVLSLAIVSSYAVQSVAAAPIESAPVSDSQDTPAPPIDSGPGVLTTEPSEMTDPTETPSGPTNEPETPPTSNEPETPPTSNEPETPPTSDEPETPPTSNEPETPPTSNEPETPPTSDEPNAGEPGLMTSAGGFPVTYAAVTDLPVNYRNYGSQSIFDNIDIHNENDYYQHMTTGSGATGTLFTEFLRNDLEDKSGSQYPLPDARVSDNPDGYTHFIDENNNEVIYLPTLIGKNDMNLIGLNLNASKLSLTIYDTKGRKYTAYVTKRGAQNIASSLNSGETVNLALSFTPSMDNKRLDIKLVGANSRRGLDGDIEYKIDFEQFNDLLTPAGLKGYALTMYNGKNGKVQKPIVTVNTDAAFTLNAENGYSVYYKIWDETEYISKTEAQQMIKDAIDGLNLADTADLKAQIAELEKQIAQLDNKYLTESEINDLINSYFKKETNLNALVEAIFKHEKFDDLVETKLKEFFSIDSSDFNIFKNILIGYIISQVTTELKNLDTRLEKLETLISKAIENQLGNIFNQNTTLDSLKDFILGLQLLGSLKGEDGKDGKDGADGKDGLNGLNGKDGIDGEDFAEWATRNYGGISNFINQISFEGWARSNYGSVDNFIRSISGTNGFSAYELAVQNGYYGSLGQWLESLRGKDGKSAYELAVENGYNGTERQWLDSLQGEDGADGEDGKDGRDGRDGNVVYVNGTYGELPSSVVASGTTQYPSNGSVNNDVTLTIDPPASSGSKKGAAANPATGAAVGIFLPAAAAISVLLVKKGGRKRGRK